MKENHSCALLGSDVDGAEVEKIGLRIVAVDLEDFGNESPAGPSLYVDDDVEGIGDICLNRIGAIYRTHWSNIFAMFGLHLSDFGRDQAMFAPPKTQLATDFSEKDDSIVVPVRSGEAFRMDRTNLLSKLVEIWGEVPVRLIQHLDLRNGVYGLVGTSDFTMYPIIRPGSIVQIDQSQRKVSHIKWETEHERPIFFVELRGEYICSWCEMNGGYLSAIPHPNSKCEVRRFSYPREAEIVGRVVGVTMRLADAG